GTPCDDDERIVDRRSDDGSSIAHAPAEIRYAAPAASPMLTAGTPKTHPMNTVCCRRRLCMACGDVTGPRKPVAHEMRARDPGFVSTGDCRSSVDWGAIGLIADIRAALSEIRGPVGRTDPVTGCLAIG